MPRKVNIQLPKALLDFPESDRVKVLAIIEEALALPKVKELPRSQNAEHNIWEPNIDEHLAALEDAMYTEFISPWAQQLGDLFHALGLPQDAAALSKSFTEDFHTWEQDLLLKAKGKRGRISELVHRSKEKRKQLIDWVKQKTAITAAQMKQIDAILRQDIPDYAKRAEAFMTRAGFIGKLRNQAERENFETVGAFLDRFPSTIEAATKEGIVLTIREKAKADSKKGASEVKILPLTPLEVEAVHYASISAADKVTEVSEKHRAQIRQMVLQANKERWSAAQLAQRLYDKFGEHNRDWRRVAITELSFAVNDAYLSGLDEGERVIGMGSVSACKHCRKYVIGKEFTVTKHIPKSDMYESDMHKVWVGKSNYGRRISEYRPCIPLHPNCRCRWHRLSRFYNVNKEGQLKRKTTAELIQEERAKRGMAPDPHIEEQLAKFKNLMG